MGILFNLELVKGQAIVDEKIVKYIRKIYSDDLDEDKFLAEMDVFGTILADVNMTSFADIYKKMKKIKNTGKSLIPNVVVPWKLLIVDHAIYTPERSSQPLCA